MEFPQHILAIVRLFLNGVARPSAGHLEGELHLLATGSIKAIAYELKGQSDLALSIDEGLEE